MRTRKQTRTPPRYGILDVGIIELRDGEIFLDNWSFHTPEGEMGLSPVGQDGGGRVAGWELAELHLIAHGHPCSCPVAEAGL